MDYPGKLFCGKLCFDEYRKFKVMSPPHYNQGPIECIAAIEAALTPDEFRGFCKGNALKYVWRAGLKSDDAIQDLEKARWYIDREIARRKKK
jgi:hypothetical protein